MQSFHFRSPADPRVNVYETREVAAPLIIMLLAVERQRSLDAAVTELDRERAARVLAELDSGREVCLRAWHPNIGERVFEIAAEEVQPV